MPELVLLTIAERVIFEQGGKPSLISLFEKIEVRPRPEEKIPSNAIVPKEWSIFAQWRWLEGEQGRDFFQGFEIKYPDDTVFAQDVIKSDSSQERANVVVGFQGFPIGQVGQYKVNIWMELNGNRATEIFSTSVHVTVRPLGPGEALPTLRVNPTAS